MNHNINEVDTKGGKSKYTVEVCRQRQQVAFATSNQQGERIKNLLIWVNIINVLLLMHATRGFGNMTCQQESDIHCGVPCFIFSCEGSSRNWFVSQLVCQSVSQLVSHKFFVKKNVKKFDIGNIGQWHLEKICNVALRFFFSNFFFYIFFRFFSFEC